MEANTNMPLISDLDKTYSAQTLEQHLSDLNKKSEQDDSRPAVLAYLKNVVADVRAQAKQDLSDNNDGLICAHTLSVFQDNLIAALYQYAASHQVEESKQDTAQSSKNDEALMIIATGGYGRGLLAPQSDIDLLFLMPSTANADHKIILDFILYMLWDLNFKVGHATRTLKECVIEAKADMTICTSLLDSRLISGAAESFEHYMTKFIKDVVKGNSRNFVQAKFEERDKRHQRSGDSRYQVEPNLKEDKGGLRDLHLLQWLSTYISYDNTIQASPEDEYCVVTLVNDIEADTILKCEQLLWTIRCHLHFLRQKPDERLSFDAQLALAKLMKYPEDTGGMQGPEHLMRDYFLNAREIGDMTRIICSALEVRHLKAQPMLTRVFAKLKNLSKVGAKVSGKGGSNETDLALPEGFISEHGRLNIVDPTLFSQNPIHLIRIFSIAVKSGSFFHPQAYRLVRENLDLIDESLQQNPEANALFLEMLMSAKYVETTLRRMTDSGVLGRFIPDFGKIDCMMQFNMYHHYTVDDHLIRAVGFLATLDLGELEEEHPLSHGLIQKVDKRVLYVAVLLHDIAKGREEDHSIAGAICAKEICPRLGLNEADTMTVAWLVEHHLDMSTYAQSRDISDPRTLLDFANLVETKKKLDLLLILTVVDIKAVGPDTWNGWKGQLLRNLYASVETLLSGDTSPSSAENVKTEKEIFANALYQQGWDQTDITYAVESHFAPYWLKTALEDQIEHAHLIRSAHGAAQSEGALYTNVKINAFTDSTEITLYRVNHPFHLMTIAAACAAVGSNITGAQILTTKKGMALDVITLQRSFELDDDETRRAENIIKLINQTISGEKSLADLKKSIQSVKGRISAFQVEPTVQIDNTISEQFTVIEIEGLDRSGLLFVIASVMSDLNIDVHSAHIATFGEKIVDVFYVTDLTHSKIMQDDRLEKTKARLLDSITKFGQEETA